MGLFGGKKTYVSSTLYNLAGDEKDRPSFLKDLVAGNIITGANPSTSEFLQSGYMNGPGIKLRNFFRWSLDNYDMIGVPTGQLSSAMNISTNVLATEIPHDSNDETVNVQSVEYNVADFSRWAMQWMYENHVDEINTEWTSDYDDQASQVVVIREDGSTSRFSPDDYVKGAQYIYAEYIITKPGVLVPVNADATAMFIYRIGSGNPNLDALAEQHDNNGQYVPSIPIRLDNKFLSPTNSPDAYELSKKAYKKATGAKYDELIDKIADNASLKDIDYAYVVFGVSLNVVENAGRKYLYDFFHRLMTSQSTDINDYDYWKEQEQGYNSTNQEWKDWLKAQDDPLDPLYDTPAPEVSSGNAIPVSEVRIKSNGTFNTDFDMQITWQAITETTGTGLKKPDARVGDVWFENLASEATSNVIVDQANLHWQVTENSWKTLNIVGMVHRNYIYKGKYVEIGTRAALEDPEESGFLVPLHYDTLKEMSLVDSTQLSTASYFIVFNSYLVVKQKWYQTTIFKIVLVAAIIALTYFTGGLGAGSVGLLGTNAAVGTAIGLTGTAAIIAGAVANAVAAMILVKLISVGAVAVFGDKLGAIIGAIAAIAALQVGTALSNGSSLAASMGNLAKADTIIAFTSAAGNGVAGYIRGETLEIANKTQKLQDQYDKDSKELKEKYDRDIGFNRAMIDPLSLTNRDQYIVEGLDTFLQRTLMTGSDVAELSFNLIHNFTDITLSPDLPL